MTYAQSRQKSAHYCGWYLWAGDEHVPDFVRLVDFQRQLGRPPIRWVGFCLMGVVLIGAIEALFSGNPGMVAMSQVVLSYSQLTHDAVPGAAHATGDGVVSQTLRRVIKVLESSLR